MANTKRTSSASSRQATDTGSIGQQLDERFAALDEHVGRVLRLVKSEGEATRNHMDATAEKLRRELLQQVTESLIASRALDTRVLAIERQLGLTV